MYFKSAWARHKAKACDQTLCEYCKPRHALEPTRNFHPAVKKVKMSRGQYKRANDVLQKFTQKLYTDLHKTEVEVANLKLKYETVTDPGIIQEVTERRQDYS
mgnify:FL=1